MKKVAFHNLGCKVNSYELDGIMQMFQKKGYEIVDFAQKADIYIVNTCTVTNIADRKSRQMLHKAKANNPDAIVVATGCYVQIDTKGASNDDAIDLIVGNNEKSKLMTYVEEYMNLRDSKEAMDGDCVSSKTLYGKTAHDISKETDYENFSIYKTMEHTRAYVKIQDGCNQFCSYCAIPFARGRVRSRSVEDIVCEVNKLSENGYKEVVLTGIHLSSYGLDKAYNAFANGDETNKELIKSIQAVANIDGIKRIRLGSLEPRLITEDFLRDLSKIEKVCPHFHLSLQSGSDSVLKRMNRHYSTEEFSNKVDLIRKYYDHPAITTDIIAGFPGETDEEFLETKEFAKKIDLYEAHIFKYSRRKGTVADKMPGQLTDKIKSIRSAALIEESNVRKNEFAKYYVGKEIEILVEDTEKIGNDTYFVGYTPEYVKCAVKEKQVANEIIKVKGNDVEGGILYCNI